MRDSLIGVLLGFNRNSCPNIRFNAYRAVPVLHKFKHSICAFRQKLKCMLRSIVHRSEDSTDHFEWYRLMEQIEHIPDEDPGGLFALHGLGQNLVIQKELDFLQVGHCVFQPIPETLVDRARVAVGTTRRDAGAKGA